MLVRYTVAVREVSRTLLHVFLSWDAAFKPSRDVSSRAYYCGNDAVTGVRNLEGNSRTEDVTGNAFKKLEELHLPSFLQKVCAHMNLKDATIRSTQSQIYALITEQWATFHFDHSDDKDFNNQFAGMRPFCSFSARGLTHSPAFFHSYTAADAKIRAEVAAVGTSQLKIGLRNWGYWEDAKSSKYRSPVAKV